MTFAAPRDRLVLALDVGDLKVATALARELAPFFAIAKVGIELYAEAGPDAFAAIHELDFAVFADLKLHDIPNTVGRAARVLGESGVEFLNFHAAGGVEMMKVGIEGLRAGAQEAGLSTPVALGVTVLTSSSDVSAFPERLVAAQVAGCDGVVCSAWEINQVAKLGLSTMVPGVRLAGSDVGDQARIATPAEAVSNGADWLVIGRTVTAANDPAAAAAAVLAEIS